MALFVGVDAGASRSTAFVADEALKLLATASGGPGAVKPDGVRQAADAILDTVRDALAKAGADRAAALVVGAAGAGREPERVALENVLAAARIATAVRATTDVEIALVAAFGEGPGILLLAGTGSGACARLPSGPVERTGGQGWQFGDEGSGYALARGAISAVAQAADGRGPPTALTQALAAAAGVRNAVELLQWARNAPRPAVADFARTVQEAAERGDRVAQALVEQAAGDLAAHLRPLVTRFPGSGPIPAALAGGLVKPGSPVRQALTSFLQWEMPRLKLLDQLVEPPRGALRLALGLLG